MSNGPGGSNSESSGGRSPNPAGEDLTDLTTAGGAPLARTGTVRRARTREAEDEGPAARAPRAGPDLHAHQDRSERYRRSLDSAYRLSLDSISEYKTKSSFSSASLHCASLDSSSSECTDCAVRSATEPARDDRTLVSPGSSYLSWIESVHSEYFGGSATTADVADVDGKVGEWNNFWLNYNSARNRYLSSPYPSTSNEERTGDDLSDAKSTCSTQREFAERTCLEQVALSVDEANEAIKCAQRIAEILQNALRRGEGEFEDSRNDSYYSQPYSAPKKKEYENSPNSNKLSKLLFKNTSFDNFTLERTRENFKPSTKEDTVVARERSYSYAMDPQEIQKQKQLLKPAAQSSSNSCINALLNTGVADILKRVITKRREVFNPEEFPPAPRGSFSDWSGTK